MDRGGFNSVFYLTRKIVSNPHFRLVQKDLESTGNKATVQIGGKDGLDIGTTMTNEDIVVRIRRRLRARTRIEEWSSLKTEDGLDDLQKDLTKCRGKKAVEIAGKGGPKNG
jgi:hypothetical protein